MKRRRFAYLSSAFVGGLVWSVEWRREGEDPSLARVRASGVLRVGLDPSYPPFASYDGAGRIDGLDVDFAREIARHLGVDLALVALDGGGLLDAVLARKCDIAIGVPPARELLRDLRYSRPYFDGGQVLVRDGRRSASLAVSPLVGVEAGSEADLRWRRIEASLSGARLSRRDSQEDLLAALASGDVDGILLDAVAARQARRVEPAFEIASEPLTHEPMVIAAHRDDSRLLREIDAVLAALAGTGTAAELTDKWLR